MRFRQVHLDFHTSELIPGIGTRFSAEQFQEMLRLGHVDSITVFSKCHHGWAYHPTTANEMHPELDYDLLGAQIEAAHAIGVKTPVYLSAGLDEKLARRRPEWLMRDRNERTNWVPDFFTAGYHQFCMNTPYLDMLVAQIEEVVQNYNVDGIFLDIVGVRECYCQNCIETARARGINPLNAAEMKPMWEETYARYAERTNAAVHRYRPELPVFHNSGHITIGRRDLALRNTHHLELESLPTGGWGYDHFPLTARYAQQLGLPFLGMTGKFHLSWGEFGGFKHPNALRYETALSLANGARCSIGDQLHPDGLMDEATYRLIGHAYKEVAEKEAWCADTTNKADIAVFSVQAWSESASEQQDRVAQADKGIIRILLEGNHLFDVVDLESDWTKYPVLVLPDRIVVNEAIEVKLTAYVAGGGKVLASGKSALRSDGSGFTVDFGANWLGTSEYCPTYFAPADDWSVNGTATSVMYSEGQRVESTQAEVLGWRENPYFNRDVFSFSSHRHTPNNKLVREPAMLSHVAGIYIAWNVFEDYANQGSLVIKEMVLYALERLLGANRTLHTTLPAQGVTTIQMQNAQNRWVHHLLYASPVRRGRDVEIIEDIVPLFDIACTVQTDRTVNNVYLAPQMEVLPFKVNGNTVSYTLPKLDCHQMIVLDLA